MNKELAKVISDENGIFIVFENQNALYDYLELFQTCYKGIVCFGQYDNALRIK